MAVVLKLEKIIVEGDCQEVIKALSDSSSSPSWRISPILKKVAHLVPFLEVFIGTMFHEKPTALQMQRPSLLFRVCALRNGLTCPLTL
ncbi:hypothetical protein ACLB2K_072436 [Fragaria x ananassa]